MIAAAGRVVVAGLALALLAGCTTDAAEVAAADPPVGGGSVTAPGRTAQPAEVAFVTGMVPHHAQALRMTSLVEDRVEEPAIGPLVWRIDGSQRSELRTMRRWLEERGAPVPSLLAEHAHDPAADAPGMLTEEQLHELDGAEGAVFDRLFLERMIEHHRGALAMVDELYASGELEDLELAQFAHEVESDQRFEIRQMEQLLERLEAG